MKRVSCRSFRRWGVVLLVLLGAGCSEPGLPDQVVAYQEAVFEALGQPRPLDPATRDTVRFPRRRERSLSVESSSMGVMDFLAIQGCELSTLVGYRNSALGKQMTPSRQLMYELALLDAEGPCLEGVSSGRAERLGQVFAEKRDALPAVIYNAVWQHPEVERFLSTRVPSALAGDERGDRAAMEEARQILAQKVLTEADAERLMLTLASLRDEPAMGVDLRDLQDMTHRLSEVAGAMQRNTDVTCSAANRRLLDAFHDLYRPQQEAMGSWGRGVQERALLLSRLYKASRRGLGDRASPAMDRYAQFAWDLEDPKGAWGRYREASRVHAMAWEPIFRACGAFPGGSDAR